MSDVGVVLWQRFAQEQGDRRDLVERQRGVAVVEHVDDLDAALDQRPPHRADLLGPRVEHQHPRRCGGLHVERAQRQPPLGRVVFDGADVDRQPHGERRSYPLGALRRDRPAQPADQLAGDRQPQPGAAVAPARRGVRLVEFVEDVRKLAFRDADPAVADDKLDVAVAGAPEADAHLALLRELGRVAGQVQQHLTQPAGVAEELRGVVGDVGDERDLLLDHRGDRLDHLGDDLGEVDRAQDQLHLVGLELGDVEQVVDQAQQVRRVPQDDREVAPGALRQGLALGQDQLGEADDAVERGAQLVGHIGQEVDLQLARARQLLVGVLELSLLGDERLGFGAQLGGRRLDRLDEAGVVDRHAHLKDRLRHELVVDLAVLPRRREDEDAQQPVEVDQRDGADDSRRDQAEPGIDPQVVPRAGLDGHRLAVLGSLADQPFAQLVDGRVALEPVGLGQHEALSRLVDQVHGAHVAAAPLDHLADAAGQDRGQAHGSVQHADQSVVVGLLAAPVGVVRGHRVERGRQLGELVAPRDADLVVELALLHLPRGSDQLPEAATDPAGHPHRQADHDQQPNDHRDPGHRQRVAAARSELCSGLGQPSERPVAQVGQRHVELPAQLASRGELAAHLAGGLGQALPQVGRGPGHPLGGSSQLARPGLVDRAQDADQVAQRALEKAVARLQPAVPRGGAALDVGELRLEVDQLADQRQAALQGVLDFPGVAWADALDVALKPS